MKTFSAKPATVERDWYLVDATDRTLGRLASEIAHRLRGKHKPEYTPHVDTGDYIVVINAEKVRVTGATSATDKMYHQPHRLHRAGSSPSTFEKQLIDKAPERVIQGAVKGMLPRNPLGRAMFKQIESVQLVASTRHAAQQPQELEHLTDLIYVIK